MHERVAGFDWDVGNRAKCEKHGVSVAGIEGFFSRPVFIIPEVVRSRGEERRKAIGKSCSVFLVFTVRERAGKRLIRPVSARYIHRKEIEHYEKENPDL